MTLKTIYIARHGYRANWLPPPHPPNPTGIDSDPPLASHGIDQAKQLAGYLNSLPAKEQPQFILSSPFYRCVQTSEPICDMLSVPLVLERGVGEWYKKDRGIVPEPANYDVLKPFFSCLRDASEWDRDSTVGVIPSLDGESEEDIFARSVQFWKEFIPVFEAKYPEITTILIVTHAATKIALGMSLLKFHNVYEAIDNDNTVLRAGACSLDKYERGGDDWSIKMNGNCEFLLDGEEMNWNFHSAFEAGSDEDIKARREEAKRKAEASNTKEQSGREPTPVTEIASGSEQLANEEYEVRS